MLSFPVTIIILLVLACISFFFSLSETAIIGLSRIRLRHMLSRKIKRAPSLQRLIANLDKFIVAILVGNNFINIAMSSIITATCVFIFGYKLGVIIATLSAAFFIVILCEITPKLLAVKNTERAALFVGPAMEAFIKLLSPVIAVFSGSSDIIIKFLGIKQARRSPLVTEEELRLMIEIGKEEGFVSDEEGLMLQRIFEFGDISVGQIMVPKEKIVAVDIENSPEQLLNIFVEEGHARLPVYKKSTDNIIGIIYANDLLYLIRDKGLFILQDLLHEAYYVPAETKVNELLRKFQADNIQIAIVVDAHKKALGLVTLEDLIEEIVGKIEEKHHKRQNKK